MDEFVHVLRKVRQVSDMVMSSARILPVIQECAFPLRSTHSRLRDGATERPRVFASARPPPHVAEDVNLPVAEPSRRAIQNTIKGHLLRAVTRNASCSGRCESSGLRILHAERFGTRIEGICH
jgi:hypothetical protein